MKRSCKKIRTTRHDWQLAAWCTMYNDFTTMLTTRHNTPNNYEVRSTQVTLLYRTTRYSFRSSYLWRCIRLSQRLSFTGRGCASVCAKVTGVQFSLPRLGVIMQCNGGPTGHVGKTLYFTPHTKKSESDNLLLVLTSGPIISKKIMKIGDKTPALLYRLDCSCMHEGCSQPKQQIT